MKTLKIEKALLLLLAFFGLQACSSDDDSNVEIFPEAIPSEILINEPGLYPSKFDFDYNKNQFVVGSVALSNVGHIDPTTGEYNVFITDDNLSSIPEVFTDEENNRLLVTCGDLGVSANSFDLFSYAYMGVYNLETGEKITGINFNDLHPANTNMMANGIAIDDNGDIYVVDTFAPVIYKVDGTTYEATILVSDDRFNTPVPTPGLFGIIYVDGNLIVSKHDDGVLFKIPLSNPNDVTVIDAPIYIGAKGMELLENDNVALAIGGGGSPFSGVITLTFEDDWTKASATSYFQSLPSAKHPIAATLASDGELYLMNSYFPAIFTDDLVDQFSIVRVD